MLKVMCAIVFLMQTGFVAAQSNEEIDSYMRERGTKNFTGWQGITFICQYDERDSVLAEVCMKGTAQFKFLITMADLDYNIVDPNDFRGSTFRSSAHGHVVLEYSLFATGDNSQNATKAIYGKLAFTLSYSSAVDLHAEESTIRSLPRDGSLELWSRTAIGSGQPDQLSDAISKDFDTRFKEAITHFLEFSSA